MSRFTEAEREAILAEARAHIAKRHPKPAEREQAAPSQQSDLIYKRRDDAVVAASPAVASASSELPWWEWTRQHVDLCLAAKDEEIGTAIADFCGPQFAALKRQIAVLEREVVQLREQIGIERELRSLRNQVDDARAQIPQVPEIAARLEKDQRRLERELDATQQKLRRTRLDQRLNDFQLRKLRETSEARSAAVELKVETASITMRQMAPAAADALRTFAHATLAEPPKWAPGPKVWHFDPIVRPHGSSSEAA
jgi:hypothetical protein